MKYEMKLNNGPFNKIKNKTKTIELRLLDEKRKLLKINDNIEFENRTTGEKLLTIIENLYNKTTELYNKIHEYSKRILNENIDELKMSKRIQEIKKIDETLANNYEEAYEKKVCFEHMLTRETPYLELANHDSIFEYSTDYVRKNDPYLKENPIGNKELVLKKYHPTPFISMPVAQ